MRERDSGKQQTAAAAIPSNHNEMRYRNVCSQLGIKGESDSCPPEPMISVLLNTTSEHEGTRPLSNKCFMMGDILDFQKKI